MRDSALPRERIPHPPFGGPGSSRAAWVDLAGQVCAANVGLQETIDEQSRAIRALQGEVALLMKRIAERRPPGSRAPLPEEKVARIEAEIADGGADRAIAKRYGVSHMTAYRLRRRMRERKAATGGAG